MQDAPEDGWNSDNDDYFDGLEDLALKFEDDTWWALFWVLSISSIVCTLVFIVVYWFYSKYNPAFFILEYGLFGVFFIPIVGNAAQTIYCDINLDMDIYDEIECFETTHYTICMIGFLAINCALLMAAGVLPVLKSDRGGIEERWENENQYTGIQKFLNVGIILVLSPVQVPWCGAVLHAIVIVYLAYYECFKDLWVASIKMAVLWA